MAWLAGCLAWWLVGCLAAGWLVAWLPRWVNCVAGWLSGCECVYAGLVGCQPSAVNLPGLAGCLDV